MLEVDDLNNVVHLKMNNIIYSMTVTQRNLKGEETEEEYSLDANFFS